MLNDNTVRLHGVVIDIAPGPRQRSYAHARVEVRQLLDGSWRVYYHERLIASAPSTASGELRALKGQPHWVPAAAPPRPNKERAASAQQRSASTQKLSAALHRTAGADSESAASSIEKEI